MSNYHNLLGRPYEMGKHDCFSILREYYSQNWGIEVPNYARPDRFWEDPNLDLYQNYRRHGFKPILDEVFEVGDLVLMPIQAAVNSHAAAIVEDNLILHHMPKQLSAVAPFRPKWSNRVTVHLRHPDVAAAAKKTEQTLQLHEVIDADILRNPNVQREIEGLLGSEG